MLTWLTIWVLTVTHTQYDSSSSSSYGVGYAYQLQYKDQATCLREAKKHQVRKIVKEGFVNTVTYVNPYKQARCDFKQVPIVLEKK